MRKLILGLAALCGTAASQPEDGRPELVFARFEAAIRRNRGLL